MVKAEWIAGYNCTATFGTLLTMGGKTYSKYNGDKCIFGLAMMDDNTIGPVLLSETKDGARYYVNGVDSGEPGVATVSYGGVEFYISNKVGFVDNRNNFSNGFLIPGSFSTIEAAAAKLLGVCGFSVKYDDSDLIELKTNIKHYLSALVDKHFLQAFDESVVKTYYCIITVLNEEEKPIAQIQGRVGSGSIINISNSTMRRSCNLNFFAEEAKNDLTNVNNLLAINKRIKIELGFDNTIDIINYPEIVWFNLGIFVITDPGISASVGGVNISLNCQDKMCLLNGSFGGNLPTSVTFDSYDQLLPNGEIEEQKQLVYDIIQTLVCNYGNIPISKILINDVPREIKQLVRWTGSSDLYFNYATGYYSIDEPGLSAAADSLEKIERIFAEASIDYDEVMNDPESSQEEKDKAKAAYEKAREDLKKEKENYNSIFEGWTIFGYNEDIGYQYVSFTYPGELISGIGDNVCSVLDSIVSTLGNYEYFFDLDGNFVFQEIPNNLNSSYDVTKVQLTSNRKPIIDEGGTTGRYKVEGNNLTILDKDNYMVDFSSSNKVAYNFKEMNNLVDSYSNSPSYTNVKNDFHVWGNRENVAIHYHLVLKQKPLIMNTYRVVFLKNDRGELTGRLRLATDEEGKPNAKMILDEDDYIFDTTPEEGHSVEDEVWNTIPGYYVENGVLIPAGVSTVIEYTPSDWRAELYLSGLAKKKDGIRPDIYEQELLDLFDSIYDFTVRNDDGSYGAFKTDIITNPNSLTYWIDYLEPAADKYDFTVDVIGTKIYSMQEDKITRLYDSDVPNLVLIQVQDSQMDEEEFRERDYQIKKCEEEAQPQSQVNRNIFKNISIGTTGYSAHSYMRDLLYRYTNYNEQITISSKPIYYLDVNTRITVENQSADIHGDYIINNISLPLEASNSMNITASRALNRI